MYAFHLEDKQTKRTVAELEHRSHAIALARHLNTLLGWNRYVVEIQLKDQGQQGQGTEAEAKSSSPDGHSAAPNRAKAPRKAKAPSLK